MKTRLILVLAAAVAATVVALTRRRQVHTPPVADVGSWTALPASVSS